jgi:hypothetical protein
VAEKQIATTMNSDLIVNLPLASRMLITKYPAEHSRSAGRAGFPKIHCLLNACPGLLQACIERGGVRVQDCVPSNGTKEMLHREHGGMFARIGMIRETAAEHGKAKTKMLQIRIMERQRKTGVA